MRNLIDKSGPYRSQEDLFAAVVSGDVR